MLTVTTHHGPGIAVRAGVTAGAGGAAGKKSKGIRMALSRKIGLVAIMAIAVHSGAGHAQSTNSQDPSAQSPGTTPTDPGSTPGVDPALAQNSPDGTPYQYGVFREVVPTVPVNQRNCWVQGLISGQTINGDLLTERVSLTQAQCVLTYLDQRGLCANQRITAYWSARQDNTTTADRTTGKTTRARTTGKTTTGKAPTGNGQGKANGQNSNWQNGNGQNNGGSQGGGSGRAATGPRAAGPGEVAGTRTPAAGMATKGPEQRRYTEQRWLAERSQWTRQGEWIRNGGVNPAWINKICGGSATAAGSTTGSANATGTAPATPASN